MEKLKRILKEEMGKRGNLTLKIEGCSYNNINDKIIYLTMVR